MSAVTFEPQPLKVPKPLLVEYMEPPYGEIAVRLADEGVPVNVLARAFRYDAEVVRNTLREAKEQGELLELPAPDWPPTARRDDRMPTSKHFFMSPEARNLRGMRYDELASIFVTTLHLSPLQAEFLAVLYKRQDVSKNDLHGVVEDRRFNRGNKLAVETETDPKMVDVVICHLRKKLKPTGVTIRTLWSKGYALDPDQKDRLVTVVVNAV